MSDVRPITQLLDAMGRGETEASERLWSLIYDELYVVAARQMAKEAPGQTLQPTALVSEAYVRLMGGAQMQWANRKQFFTMAAKVMRHIRTDAARKRYSQKRGGHDKPGSLRCDAPVCDHDASEMLAINEALDALRAEDARKADVVELRYFAGLTVDETAAVLGVSPRTVESDWRFARLWLYDCLSDDSR